MKIALLGILIFSIVLSGCIQTQDTNEFENQIQILQTENTNLQQENIKIQELQSKEKESTIDFFKEYSIALVNIHIAMQDLSLAEANLTTVNYESLTPEGYDYSSLTGILEGAIDQTKEAQSLLSRAERKLQSIENKTSNPFFKKETQNRMQHVQAITEYANSLKSILEYRKNEFYEVNYGSDEKAEEYNNKYNDLVPSHNSTLEKLSEIQEAIELEWDQEWYP